MSKSLPESTRRTPPFCAAVGDVQGYQSSSTPQRSWPSWPASPAPAGASSHSPSTRAAHGGLLDRPTRRAPFSTATYPTRDDLRYLGSRYGRARVRGRLFTAAHPSFLYHLEPLAALLGHAAPWLGAVQVLTLDRPT